MAQARECLHAALALDAGILLPLDAVQVVDPALQLRRAAAAWGLGPPLSRALTPLHHAVVLGPSRRVPDDLDPQPEEPQRQLGGQVAGRAPGRAIVDPDPRWHPPAAERLPQLLLGLG